MKQNIDFNQFREAFYDAGRSDTFSLSSLEAIFDYLEENYTNYELDVIELCSEFSEDTLEDINDRYTLVDVEDYTDSRGSIEYEYFNAAVLKELEAETLVLNCDKSNAFWAITYLDYWITHPYFNQRVR